MATTTGTSTPKLPKAGFWWALGIFLVTAVVAIVMVAVAIFTLANAIEDFDDVPVGEVVNVTVDEGEYVVYASTPGGSARSLTEISVEDPSGRPVSVDTQSDFYPDEVDHDGRTWEFVAEFDADVDGQYRMLIDGPEGSEARIGDPPIERFLGLMFGGIAVGAVGFLVALVLVIVTLVRRGRAKKQLAQAHGAYPGGTTPQPHVPPAPRGYPAPGPQAPPAPPGTGGAPSPAPQPPPTPPPPAPPTPAGPDAPSPPGGPPSATPPPPPPTPGRSGAPDDAGGEPPTAPPGEATPPPPPDR